MVAVSGTPGGGGLAVGVQPGRKIFNTLIKKGAARIEDRLKIFLSGARRLSDRREDWRSAVGGWRGGESAFFPALCPANARGERLAKYEQRRSGHAARQL